MSEAMDFLWSLMGRGFDSWNITFRLQEFSAHIPGFLNLSADIQDQVVTNLDTEDIQNLELVWLVRDRTGDLDGYTFTDFLDKFILDPNATDTILPSFIPTLSEICQLYRHERVQSQSFVMLIPSTIVMLILMFLKPRKTLWPRCLWGRPSLLVPVNFIDEHGRRWAFCGAFAVMTSFLIDFVGNDYFWNPGNWTDAGWALRFSWLRPFILLGNVIHLGYLFYPLFACLSLRRHIPANCLGLVYAFAWIWIDAVDIVNCPIAPKRGATTLDVAQITRIVTFIPIFLGELALILAFILDLVINSYKCHLKRTNQAHKHKRKSRWGGKETLPLQYIEYLMTAHQEKPKTLKEKIKQMFAYTSVIGFKYPPRIICTIAVAFVLLLSFAISVGTEVDGLLIPFEQSTGITEILVSQVGDIGNLTGHKAIHQAPRYVSALRGCIIFANIVASLVHFGSMLHIVITYRTRVRMTMRGDRSWHYDFDASPPTKLVNGMRYSGYQIAYLLWGYVIMFVLVAIISTAVTIIIIIPITFREKPFFFDKIIIIISTAVGTYLISFTQTTTAKYGFLQDRGAYLALNNRYAYHIFSYFIFFFNIVVGLFSVLKRSLFSMFFGTILLCRLDRCLLMRGFEKFDKGFNAYLAMLEVDATHNHPVLKGFIYILKEQVKDSKERQQEKSNGGAEKAVGLKGMATRRIDKRVRNKWWKLITLVNNPVLVIERLQKKVKEEREKEHDMRHDVVDMIATTGAVFTRGRASGVDDQVDGVAPDFVFSRV